MFDSPDIARWRVDPQTHNFRKEQQLDFYVGLRWRA